MFLVLREKVALERFRSRDSDAAPVPQAGDSGPVPGPSGPPEVGPMEVQVEVQGRGHKRSADTDPSSPSKRQAL